MNLDHVFYVLLVKKKTIVKYCSLRFLMRTNFFLTISALTLYFKNKLIIDIGFVIIKVEIYFIRIQSHYKLYIYTTICISIFQNVGDLYVCFKTSF